MKLKLIVAMLGLSASAAALADPFVPNGPTPSTINVVANGELSLQTIVNNEFGPGHINVDTGQSSAAFFTSASATPSLIPTLIAEFTDNKNLQIFGIWFGTDTTPAHRFDYDLLLGSAEKGNAAGLTISGNTLDVFGSDCTKIHCGIVTNALINSSSFGFYFKPNPNGPTYYTLDQLNPGPDHKDRVVAFQDGATTNWLFAYEDGAAVGGDFDYNDMAVKVESIVAVPEPETYALMLAGLGAMGFMARRRKSR